MPLRASTCLVARFCRLPACALRLARCVPLHTCTCVLARFCRCLSARLVCFVASTYLVARICRLPACTLARSVPFRACICLVAGFLPLPAYTLQSGSFRACTCFVARFLPLTCACSVAGLGACLPVLCGSGSRRFVLVHVSWLAFGLYFVVWLVSPLRPSACFPVAGSWRLSALRCRRWVCSFRAVWCLYLLCGCFVAGSWRLPACSLRSGSCSRRFVLVHVSWLAFCRLPACTLWFGWFHRFVLLPAPVAGSWRLPALRCL